MNEYKYLYKYYDELLNDEEILKQWINDSLLIKPSSILDLACGSGNASIIYHDLGYNVTGIDLSESMIRYAQSKNPNIEYHILNMINFNLNHTYDLVVCFMDSINYLTNINDIKQTFINVYNHLNDKGLFMFDIHTLKCLEIYQQEYIEEGIVLDTEYQWTIISENKKLLSKFVFYNGDYKEDHTQYIYDPIDIEKLLNEIGFNVIIDKINEEKYMFKAYKNTIIE